MNIKTILSKLSTPYYRSRIDSQYGIGRLERLFYSNWFNPVATLYVNFRSFPFLQAIRLPLWVYGRPRFYSLSGRMRVDGKISSGMIKFNMVKFGAPGNMSSKSELYNLGDILFKGKCEIGTGNKIIVGYGKSLSLGNNSVIMDRCCIAVHEKIVIGGNSRIAHSCQIMDTNYHFVADLNKMEISPRTNPVNIGKGCWICNSSSIMPGSNIPDYAIVGSHSLVNRDFSQYTKGCIIAGTPAKLIKEGFVRVFNSNVENDIWKYYNINGKSVYHIDGYSIEQLVDYN